MNGDLLQNLAVAAIVLGAAGFLVWRRVRRRARPTAMCGDCPGCAPAPMPDRRPTFVKIESLGPKR